MMRIQLYNAWSEMCNFLLVLYAQFNGVQPSILLLVVEVLVLKVEEFNELLEG
jgi:hypothetical protein